MVRKICIGATQEFFFITFPEKATAYSPKDETFTLKDLRQNCGEEFLQDCKDEFIMIPIYEEHVAMVESFEGFQPVEKLIKDKDSRLKDWDFTGRLG